MIDYDLLFKECLEARKTSYSPYSNFSVGAAILLSNGKIIRGTNIENAAYPSGICAERVALFTTYAAGYKKQDILALAIIGDTKNPITPCGACRQVMQELLSADTEIVLFNLNKDTKVLKMKDLLPYSFDEEDLK